MADALAARDQKMQEALDSIAALNETADSRLAGWVSDIRVAIRDRELDLVEVTQERDRLQADNDRLRRELLAVNNYAVLRHGTGWDSEYDLIHWDEHDMVWTPVEKGISPRGATTLRDTYNAQAKP